MRRTLCTAVGAGALSLILAAGGCGGSSAGSTSDVTLTFAATAGSAPVGCGQPITGLGTSGATAQLMDMRLYVSEVALLPQDGGDPVPLTLGPDDTYNRTTPDGAVTMLDFEDGTGMCKMNGDAGTNTTISGTVPEGTYSGVRFTVGVPESMNHTDPTTVAAPLNLTAMSWDWQAGRKFTKIEVTDPTDGTAWKDKAFMVHLGSTGCSGNPAAGEEAACMHANRAAVVLPGIDPAQDTIAVDLAQLVAGTDVTRNAGGSPGCMSGPDDPDCGPVFGNLGIDWKADGSGTGEVVGDGTSQTVFTVM